MDESVYKYDSWTAIVRSRVTRLKSFARSTAAHNSNLGMVSLLSGATLDVEHKSSQKT
jgi:hypothetical protein